MTRTQHVFVKCMCNVDRVGRPHIIICLDNVNHTESFGNKSFHNEKHLIDVSMFLQCDWLPLLLTDS